MGDAYKGDLSVRDCWEILSGDPDAFLVDVRTSAEWSYVGFPDTSVLGKQPVFMEWQSYPAMAVAPDFAARLSEVIAENGGSTDSKLLFLCRSGVRSMASAAAMTAAGFRNCYNVVDGFEGGHDEEGHRGRRSGWKAEGLPWAQR